jgi:cytochrome P450
MSKRAKALHQEELTLYKSYLTRVRKRIADGTSPPCFCDDMFKSQEKNGFTDDWASYVSGTLLEAGSDTTASIFLGFIVAMVNFPEAQKKAQEELDRIVGPNRLPRMDDDLPYIRMVVKESLRYLPSSIMGIVPHATSTDDYYKGYFIPKNAGVVCNVWTLNNDPERYPEPRVFRPERSVAFPTTQNTR